MPYASGSARSRELDGLPEHAEVLIFADPSGPSRRSLRLDFRRATIVIEEPSIPRVPPASLDAVIIDRHPLDLGDAELLARGCRPALRPDGQIIIFLDGHVDPPALHPTPATVTAHPAPATATAPVVPLAATNRAWAGLEWRGLHRVDGRPCAVLRVKAGGSEPGTGTATLLSTAQVALQLGASRTAETQLVEFHRRLLAAARAGADREAELLARLDVLTTELAAKRGTRRGPAGLRVLARRSRCCRSAIAVLRWPVRLCRAIPSMVRLERPW